jgi:hypothetical protein
MGRTERKEFARWANLAKGPDCRGDNSSGLRAQGAERRAQTGP